MNSVVGIANWQFSLFGTFFYISVNVNSHTLMPLWCFLVPCFSLWGWNFMTTTITESIPNHSSYFKFCSDFTLCYTHTQWPHLSNRLYISLVEWLIPCCYYLWNNNEVWDDIPPCAKVTALGQTSQKQRCMKITFKILPLSFPPFLFFFLHF